MRFAILVLWGLWALFAGSAAAQSVHVTQGFGISADRPDIAYSPLSGEYLIVWDTKNGNIVGRTVDNGGNLGPIQTIFDAAPFKGPSQTVFFSHPAVTFQPTGAPDGDDGFYVVARVTQTVITGVVNRGREIVGRKLDIQGTPTSPIVSFSSTGLGSASPPPLIELDTYPDIAANPKGTQPLVTWSQSFKLRAAYWPDGTPPAPFTLDGAKGFAISSPSVTTVPEARGRDPHFVIGYPYSSADTGNVIQVMTVEPGAEKPDRIEVIAKDIAFSPANLQIGLARYEVPSIAVTPYGYAVSFRNKQSVRMQHLDRDLSPIGKLHRVIYLPFEYAHTPTVTAALGEDVVTAYPYGGRIAQMEIRRHSPKELKAARVLQRTGPSAKRSSADAHPAVAVAEEEARFAVVWSTHPIMRPPRIREIWVELNAAP